MTDVLANPVFLVGLLLFVLVLMALAWVGSRQPYVREVERLREDVGAESRDRAGVELEHGPVPLPRLQPRPAEHEPRPAA